MTYNCIIDPLSEGLVTPPLGVEKLSPGLNFIDTRGVPKVLHTNYYFLYHALHMTSSVTPIINT